MIRIAALLLPAMLFYGVRLEAKLPALNDRGEIQLESAVDLEIKTKDSSGNEQARTSSILRTEKFTQVVTEADGKNRTFKVSCASSSVQRSGTNVPVSTEKTEIDGKTYLLSRGATSRVLNEDGSAAPESTLTIGAWEDYGMLLPKNEVDAGSTWAVEGDDIAGLFGLGKLTDVKSAITGKVETLESEGVLLAYTGTLQAQTPEGFELKFTLDDCKMSFSRSRGRPTSIMLKATLEASKKVMQSYIPPGSSRPKEEQIGEASIKSRKFEVMVTYR
jgi:hypothetical protein